MNSVRRMSSIYACSVNQYTNYVQFHYKSDIIWIELSSNIGYLARRSIPQLVRCVSL